VLALMETGQGSRQANPNLVARCRRDCEYLLEMFYFCSGLLCGQDSLRAFSASTFDMNGPASIMTSGLVLIISHFPALSFTTSHCCADAVHTTQKSRINTKMTCLMAANLLVKPIRIDLTADRQQISVPPPPITLQSL
jgi:hypothetical protein